jgi:hypothetical protein
VPDTVDKLEEKLKKVDEKLEAVTDWCTSNSFDTVPVAVLNLQAKVNEIQVLAASRFSELAAEISVTRSAVGHGSGTGGQSSAWVEKDRNVFDVRDYKLSDLGAKPTGARWKKWRRDLESFVDSIGASWKGTSGLLRQLRHCETAFTEGQVEAAVQKARARGDKAPASENYNYDDKKDVLYRLLMPRLDEILGWPRPAWKMASSSSANWSANSTRLSQTSPST